MTPTCPYCTTPSTFLPSSESVYGTDYGPLYRCQPCNSHVGCHPGTVRPLGRLANAHLRAWKKEAHLVFDPMRRAAIEQGRSKSKARNAAYGWLASEMKIGREDCHIGMFDVVQCKKVVAIVRQWNSNKITQL